jgi:hypothetical protein
MSGLSAYQKEESKFKGIEYLFTEIVVEIFLCLWKELDITTEAHRNVKSCNGKGICPKHITVKIPKVQNKHRILKSVRENCQVIF